MCHLTWMFWCLNVVICVNVNLRNTLMPRHDMKSKHLWLKRQSLATFHKWVKPTMEKLSETQRTLLQRASTLSKSEVMELLNVLGIPFRSTWTVVELKGLLADFKKEAKSGSIDATINHMANQKRPEAEAEAKKRGVFLTGTETHAQILRKTREHLTELAMQNGDPEAMSETMVDFGAHRGKTYGEIREEVPSYAEWALGRLREDPVGTTGPLRKLAVWLEAMEATTRAERPADLLGPEPTAKAKAKAVIPQRGYSSSDHKQAVAKPIPRKVDEFDLFTETSEQENPEGPPQWDGSEETLETYLLETRVWKAKHQQRPLTPQLLPSPPMGASVNSSSSWVQPSLPTVRASLASMDTSHKNVHPRDEQ